MLVLGHRGAPRRERENTLASFGRALELGADGVELDVRMTADGMLALRHDDGFASGERVSTSTLEDIRRLEPAVPLLAEALDVMLPGVCVVEMKTQPGRNGPFCDAVASVLATREQRIVVSSFDPTILRRMRVLLPALRTALLVGMVSSDEERDAMIVEARDAGHAEMHVARRVLGGDTGGGWFSAGLDVVAWTVNDAAEVAALRDRGLFAVITDVPDEVAAAL